MTEFLVVMGLAALPALANFLGDALAEVFRVSARSLSLALHLAAGIVLAVVGLELMPEALQGIRRGCRCWPSWLAVGFSSVSTGSSGMCKDASAEERTSPAPWQYSGACRWTCSAMA